MQSVSVKAIVHIRLRPQPGAARGESLRIRPTCVARYWSLWAKNDVIHKTGSVQHRDAARGGPSHGAVATCGENSPKFGS